MTTPDIASLCDRLLRRAQNTYNFRDLAGLEADLREAATRLRAVATVTDEDVAWPSGVLNREATIRTLTEHNAWRRGARGPQTDPVMLGKALDAAIAALESFANKERE